MNGSKDEVKQFLAQNFSISEGVGDFLEAAEQELFERFDELENIKEYNQYKVLKAFQKNRISDNHFAWNTGYELDDDDCGYKGDGCEDGESRSRCIEGIAGAQHNRTR